MGQSFPTITAALDSSALLKWTEHRDHERLEQEARATLHTESMRDWLMGDISGHCEYLGLTSLDWLATDADAPSRTSEHLGSRGNWWFIWILHRTEVQSSIDGLNAILSLAHEHPGRFGATIDEISAAHDWDAKCQPTDFEMPDPSGDGNDPIYVLCSLFGLRRLLTIAQTEGLTVLHMRYSFRH